MSDRILRPPPLLGSSGSLPLAAVLLAALLTLPAAAQSRGRGPIVLNLPGSTRALAMGNSFTLGSQDPDAVFYQPGLLSQTQGFGVSIQRYGSAATLASFTAGGSWLSGGVVLGIQQLGYGADASEPILGDDLLRLPADIGSLRENGEVGVSELVVSAGYGRSVKGLRMGFVGKLVEERFGPRKSATAAFDLGLAASPGPLTVGLAVQNLGPAMTIGEAEVPLPLRFSLGASSDRTPLGPLDLSAASAVSYSVEGDVIPSVGLEVAYWPVTGRTFIGRLGLRHVPDHQSASPLTFGAAFTGDNIVLEYAFEAFDSGDPSHRFTIGWR
jgi:hypothetical protein